MAAWGYIPTVGLKGLVLRYIGHPHPLGRIRTKIVSSLVDTKSKKTLDLGCGEGAFCREFAMQGMEMIGLDTSKHGLAFARQIAKKMHLDVLFVQGDAMKTPFKAGEFDQVLCLDVIEHTPHPERVLDEIGRVLKKEGNAIITVPNEKMLFNPILPVDFSEHLQEIRHINRGYGYEELKKELAKRGLKEITHIHFDKFFSQLAMELVYLVMGPKNIKRNREKMYKHSWLAIIAFCVVYPIMHLDALFPKEKQGAFTAIKVRKVK